MIKWGIIGTGTIAYKFAEAFFYSELGQLIGCYGRTETKSRRLAKHFNIQSFSSLEALLEVCDVVYIGTTNDSHYSIAKRCLEAKIPVLLEKPFTMNLKQTLLLHELASSHKTYIMEALWTLHLPTIKTVKSWIGQGLIGQIKSIKAEFAFKGQDKNSRLFKNELGGGSLLDVGIYPLLFFNYFADSKLVELHSIGNLYNGIDLTTHFQLKYENAILATGTSSIDYNGINQGVIYGTNGYIVIDDFWMAKHASLHTDQNIEFVDDSQGLGYHYEIDAVSMDLMNARLENKLANMNFTQELSRTLDQIRAQIGVVYKEDRGG